MHYGYFRLCGGTLNKNTDNTLILLSQQLEPTKPQWCIKQTKHTEIEKVMSFIFTENAEAESSMTDTSEMRG